MSRSVTFRQRVTDSSISSLYKEVRNRGTSWANWSGSERCNPAQIHEPESRSELRTIVTNSQGTDRTIRVAGAGHSFGPLVPTDDVLISMKSYTGIESIDPNEGTVTVRGGTRLETLAERLADAGFALETMGDNVDVTVAGAVSTGTHGPGDEFGSISSMVRRMRFVTASGDVVECSPDDRSDVFHCGRLSLGTFGVLESVTLRVRPKFRLKHHGRPEPIDRVLESVDEYRERHRHFSFFWFPGTETALVWTADETDEAPTSGQIDAIQGPKVVWKGMCWLTAAFPHLRDRLISFAERGLADKTGVGPSHDVLSGEYEPPFNELEYAVPADRFQEVFRAFEEFLGERDHNVLFPICVNFTDGDDVPLSPFFGRTSANLGIPVYHRKPYRELFDECAKFFESYGGRPHWGKNPGPSPSHGDPATLYPEWDRFDRRRKELDPEGRFLNEYTERLFRA